MATIGTKNEKASTIANTIKIRTKEQIIKGGYCKSDAQVILKEGPENWASSITESLTNDADYIVENDTVSFYTR